jgi:hypothetical protein
VVFSMLPTIRAAQKSANARIQFIELTIRVWLFVWRMRLAPGHSSHPMLELILRR